MADGRPSRSYCWRPARSSLLYSRRGNSLAGAALGARVCASRGSWVQQTDLSCWRTRPARASRCPGSESQRVCQRCKGGSALRRAATPHAYKGAAGEKTSNKIDKILPVAIAAQEDSLRSLQQQTIGPFRINKSFGS